MIRIRRMTLWLSILLLGSTLLSVAGVYANFMYATGRMAPVERRTNIILSEFVWKPEEILPTDTPGENYILLLESILENNKGDLNSGKDTLEKAVLQYEVVHSSQNVQGGNLKHLKDMIPDDSEDLDFLVQRITDNEFHLYMFEHDDAHNGVADYTQIKVYNAILTKNNNKWEATEAQLGYAALRYLPNSNNYIAIDPAEWVRGYLPAA